MASIIKTDNIQKVSDDSNIIKKCGSTTTVGSGAGKQLQLMVQQLQLVDVVVLLILHQAQRRQVLVDQVQLIGVQQQRQVPLRQQVVQDFLLTQLEVQLL